MFHARVERTQFPASLLQGAPGPAYTGGVRVWLLLLAVCGFGQASEFAHSIKVPAGSRVEAPAVTRLGDWEVTVSFDEARCEILCVYRNRSERLPVLLPPAVPLRIYSGMQVSTVVIDPAHTRDYSALPLDRLEDPDEAAPVRLVAAVPMVVTGAVVTPAATSAARNTFVPPTTAPLRI